MTISNNGMIAILALLIATYAIVLGLTLWKYPSLKILLFLNCISTFAILMYWTNKQLTISQHYFEFREMSVVFVEVLFFALSAYSLLNSPVTKWIKFLEYFIFGTHLTAIIALLIFGLTFKMNRLF